MPSSRRRPGSSAFDFIVRKDSGFPLSSLLKARASIPAPRVAGMTNKNSLLFIRSAAMKHTLSILLQNESGALVRVAGLFAARHCNIDTLTVAATHDPEVSQITLVMHGDANTLEQILRQLRKLVDVLDANSLSLVGSRDDVRLAVALPA
jgi:acetolactate synthase-1/3 small subunit